MRKTRKKELLFMLAIMGVILLGGCGLGKTEVDLSNYVMIQTTGYDGKGTATYTIDTYALENDLQEKMGGKKGLDSAQMAKLNTFEGTLVGTFDKSEGLSNGDNVTLSLQYNKEQADELKLSLSGLEIDKTVEGLQEVVWLDPFAPEYFDVDEGKEGIVLDYTGVSPEASLDIRNTFSSDNPMSEIQYSKDEDTGNIKKGDSIVIYASFPSSEYYDSDYYDSDDSEYNMPEENAYEINGKIYMLKETQTTVTCEQVSEYVNTFEDIDQETWDKLKAQCDDLVASKLDTNDEVILRIDKYTIPDIHEYKNFAYQKCYLMNLKDGMDSDDFSMGMDRNQLIVQYTLDVTEASNFFDSLDSEKTGCCGAIYIDDIIHNKKGEVELNIGDIKMGYVYLDEDSLVNDMLNANADYYTYQEQPLNWQLGDGQSEK